MASPRVVTPIGFTGTREGYGHGDRGKAMFDWLVYLRAGYGAIEAHHGDCDGSDKAFHNQCRAMGIPRVIHPPINPKHRAFADRTDAAYGLTKSNYTIVLSPGAYLDRDQDIVNVGKVLLATPKGRAPEPGSGTWATINMARGARLWIILVYPDGSWQDEGPRPLWCGIRDERYIEPDELGHRWDGDHCIVCGFDHTDAIGFGSKLPTCAEWRVDVELNAIREGNCNCLTGRAMICRRCSDGETCECDPCKRR